LIFILVFLVELAGVVQELVLSVEQITGGGQ
jgi:hypothetical protein